MPRTRRMIRKVKDRAEKFRCLDPTMRAARINGTMARIVATAVAVRPTRVARRKHSQALGILSRRTIRQITNQKTKMNHVVGMRTTAQAWAGTKNIQPRAAITPINFGGEEDVDLSEPKIRTQIW